MSSKKTKVTADRVTRRLRNPHPGEILREDFLKPWQMTPYRLAKGLGVTPARVSEILRGKRAVTADTALRLSRFLGCSPRFWLGLQAAYDLEEAERELGQELDRVQHHEHDGPIYLDDEVIEPEASRPPKRAAAKPLTSGP